MEQQSGSPDNALIGLNVKANLKQGVQLYGQLVLDEFLLKEIKARNGWWANKQGLMAGFKSYNVFGIKNLHVQTEFSYVRPYTYEHREPLGNYGHYRQSLAHPMGANFWESVNFIYYKYKKLDVKARLSYAIIGYDYDSLNYGQNIYKSYEVNRPQEYGNSVGQGLKTSITIPQLTVAYIINPAYNMKFFIDVMGRMAENRLGTQKTFSIQAGICTNLFNRYYDY